MKKLLLLLVILLFYLPTRADIIQTVYNPAHGFILALIFVISGLLLAGFLRFQRRQDPEQKMPTYMRWLAICIVVGILLLAFVPAQIREVYRGQRPPVLPPDSSAATPDTTAL